ncbi:adenylate/guanylate cyclase domain-containing protein [Fodinicola feengrottensis]|uniref:adenylate/guanylate cyclase domain-containing protein n=1 Tax=Fodinicola feengrottensis TaxID=435914 RepID=UPI0013D6654D|nr:adenylate/guanylate cyclase domain-containing protein [Fodinicola feengrottensis]
MHCVACAAALPAAARFCPSCGSPCPPTPVPQVERRKLVTALFCDLVGSTELSGILEPETLRSVVLRYFDVMRDQIEAHGGLVEKFIGDAVMAVFGIPTVHENDAHRAAAAALDMVAALAELNEDLSRTLGCQLAVRIGINTGEVVATAQEGTNENWCPARSSMWPRDWSRTPASAKCSSVLLPANCSAPPRQSTSSVR